MKFRINKVKRKDEYAYYIATSIRNKNRVSTKNVLSLGTDSYIKSLGEDVNEYLNKQLEEYNNKNVESSISMQFNPNKQIVKGNYGFVDAGSIFIKRIFDDIKLNETLDNISKRYKLKYSLSEVSMFHLSGRIIKPDSKLGMYEYGLKHSLKKLIFSKDAIYRAMDVLEDNRVEILKNCYENLPYKVERQKKILYYDCTNTYFESELEYGLRAKGKGKRNEKEPLVSFGLAMDASGIPLTYNVFKGSQNEQGTLIPLEEEIEKEFHQSEFVMITDAGLSSKNNRAFNSIDNRKYITTLPVRCMSQEKKDLYIFDTKKEWIEDIFDSENNEESIKKSKKKKNEDILNTPEKIKAKYDLLNDELTKAIENNADDTAIKEIKKQIYKITNIVLYKRFPVKMDKKPIKYLKNPKKDKNDPDKCYIDEDYLVSYSLKYELRQKNQRKRMIDKAQSMLKNPGKLTKNGPLDPKQYILECKEDTATGEVKKTKKDNKIYCINTELIEEQEKLDGYYCVATNLLEDENKDIINAMKYRWFIEDSFRLMKQQFNFRPVNHSKDGRIKAHFMLCFLSLLIYRYIQKMCHESEYESLKYITDEELIDLMREYKLTIVKKDFFFPSFDITDQISDIEKLFNIFLTREIITPAILNKELSKSLRGKR